MKKSNYKTIKLSNKNIFKKLLKIKVFNFDFNLLTLHLAEILSIGIMSLSSE